MVISLFPRHETKYIIDELEDENVYFIFQGPVVDGRSEFVNFLQDEATNNKEFNKNNTLFIAELVFRKINIYHEVLKE
jgi:endo-beta-N-acetylglucosaminidase D